MKHFSSISKFRRWKLYVEYVLHIPIKPYERVKIGNKIMSMKQAIKRYLK